VAYGQVTSADQEIRAHDLPNLMAKTHDPGDVLKTSLDTIIHDRDVCCGKDSALEDTLDRVDPTSLKDVGAKLNGRHLLSDGRPIAVTTEYLAGAQVSAGHLIAMLKDNRIPIVQWNSHLYVVEGVVYILVGDGQGGYYPVIHKLQLVDTRFSDSHRQVLFTVGSDDVNQVIGMLFVDYKLQ
jgi:hypothetical protein